jgi:hypothetical protein
VLCVQAGSVKYGRIRRSGPNPSASALGPTFALGNVPGAEEGCDIGYNIRQVREEGRYALG